MATLGTISIHNIATVISDIESYGDAIKEEVDYEMEASCITIVGQAKIAAANDQGVLVRGISYVKRRMFSYDIVSAANYSAFIEFGTKKQVSIPTGFESLAAQFRGIKIDTGGLSFEEAIKQWAVRHGIDPVDAHYIMILIAYRGIKPHPFLLPAYIKETIQLEKRLRKILES